MSTHQIAWIVIAAVAVVLIVVLIIVARRATIHRRQRQAAQIRQEASVQTEKVERREALAAETAAKARAAQAEAEAKAAEAARLQDRAGAHQSAAATSREQVQEQWERADRIDPRVDADRGAATDQSGSERDTARSGEQPTDADVPQHGKSSDYRDTR
ncbi:hypothetical protein B8W69_23755 [Mycobacterium vulneris]|uniref:Uncharacterized protein n=1 Tax=Mycolicibacterium vulneris TaxID=547163 RepID=A0A1X2KP18_9MYCO|nr:hypothetical protein [Mycolicibacterium vulneris]OSC23500.1 hypothetical protein B8W69_23755 [Mycolicibacterium vulneris]